MIFLRSNAIASLIFIPWVCRGRNFYPFSCFFVFVECPYLMRSVTNTILPVLLWTCSLLLRTIIFLLTFCSVSSWLSLGMQGIRVCCWILNLRDNMKKSKYIRWYFEEGVNWPRGWNPFFPSTHPRVLRWVRSKLCWYWSQQKLTRILSLGIKKKKARGDRGGLHRKREEGFLVMDSG